MSNRYERQTVAGGGIPFANQLSGSHGKRGSLSKKILPLFLFAGILFSFVFSACNPLTDDLDKENETSSSAGKSFFSLTVRADGASENTRAAVSYEPEVTWHSEQGFRDTVTDFVITVGNEAPQTVMMGESVTSRRAYPVGRQVTVSYEAYGNVDFKNAKGETQTKREIIASDSKTVTVSAKGTTVNFKVSEGVKTPGGYEVEAVTGRVTYSWGEANRHGTKNGLPTDANEYEVGDAFTVLDGSNMTWQHANKPGKGFAGWTSNVPLEPTDGGQATNSPTPNGRYKMPDGGVVLTANWNKNTYNITYNLNLPIGVSGGNIKQTPNDQTDIPALDAVRIYDTALEVTNNPIGSKTYTFVRWNGNDGNNYSPNQEISMLTGDLVLTAEWSDKNVYTITFEQGIGPTSFTQQVPSPITVVAGNTSESWTNPTATGYTFTGWKITETGNPNNVIDPNRGTITNYNPDKNVTLTAQWTALPVASIGSDNYDNFTNAWDAANSTSGAVLKLEQDVSIIQTINVTSDFTLDLNGHTLSGNNSFGLIDVSANFTVKDSTGNNGMLTGGSQGNGGVIYMNPGNASSYLKFTLESGIITGNNSPSGGNIYLNSYTEFVMNGGEISENTGRDGAAVYMATNTKFTMSDGEIKNNRATGSTNNSDRGGAIYCNGGTINIEAGSTISGNTAANGGAIYLQSGTLTVAGGQIMNNTATTAAGGIYVGGGVTFNIGGNAINITNNKQANDEFSNVYLSAANSVITVTAALGSSNIGVRLGDYSGLPRTITSRLNSYGNASNFSSDAAGYTLEIYNDEIVLKQP